MQILLPQLASSPAGTKLMCADLIVLMLFVRNQALSLSLSLYPGLCVARFMRA